MQSVPLQHILSAETKIPALHLRIHLAWHPENVGRDVAHRETLPIVGSAKSKDNIAPDGVLLDNPNPKKILQISSYGLDVAHGFFLEKGFFR